MEITKITDLNSIATTLKLILDTAKSDRELRLLILSLIRVILKEDSVKRYQQLSKLRNKQINSLIKKQS